jgi:hypothetical protein
MPAPAGAIALRVDYGRGMGEVPGSRHRPAENVGRAVELFGRGTVIDWCDALLQGIARDDDPRHPDIAWLSGTVGWPEHWARVWGARGLLHAGPPVHPAIVLDALEDTSWRVREMSLKVVTRHALDDPDGRILGLLDDSQERVRLQALRALGVPPSARRTSR